MYSTYFIRLNLDPVVRNFLYGYFFVPLDEALKFPFDHKFYSLLEFNLQSKSHKSIACGYWKCNTEIQLPNKVIANINLPPNISEKGNKILSSYFRRFMSRVIKDNFNWLKFTLGLSKGEIIQSIMNTYKLKEEDKPAIQKLYKQWSNSVYVSNYRKKHK